MTENTITVTRSQARALAEVIRCDVERRELLTHLDRYVWIGSLSGTFTYDLGVLPTGGAR